MNYTQMSKSLGWTEQTITIPSDEELDIIIEKSKNGDSSSYYQLFKINRFGDFNKETGDRINKAVEAFREYKHLYE